MIDWNALHATCVDRITLYKEKAAKAEESKYPNITRFFLNKVIMRYEALLEFIDTRIQKSINQPV